MKRILALVLLTLSASSFAHGYYGYRGGYYGYRGPVYVNNYGYNNNWVAPALAGVVVGAAIARPYYAPPVVYTQPPVVYTQPAVTYVQQANPAGYHQESILDAACNCYRTVLVPN